MRRFYKVSAIIAGILLCIGLLLAIVGVASGASILNIKNIYLKKNRGFIMENIVGELRSQEINGDINRLKLDLDYGEVYIEEGEGFSIKYSKNLEPYIKISEKAGALKVQNYRKSRVFDFGFINKHINRNQKIILIVPRDLTLKEVDISFGAGKMEIDKIIAETLDIDLGTGFLRLKEVKAESKAAFDVGAGAIEIDNINANNVKVDCGVGEIKVKEGQIRGENKIDCGVGNVKLNLEGNEDDYNYYIDSGIGNVNINDSRYSFTSSSKMLNDSASNEFKIDCGIGNVDIIIK